MKVTREQAESFIRFFQTTPVDVSIICPYCNAPTTGVEILPEPYSECYQHNAMCRNCVADVIARHEKYRREAQEWEERARSGFYGSELQPVHYDAGSKTHHRDAHPGWVYIGQTDHAAFKIGATRRSVQVRLTASVSKFVHAIYTEYPFYLESSLHRRFSKQRRRGEYFTLSDEDIEEIGRIKAVCGIPVIHVTRLKDTRKTRRDNVALPL